MTQASFYIDTSKDTDNLQFESLYQFQIPEYKIQGKPISIQSNGMVWKQKEPLAEVDLSAENSIANNRFWSSKQHRHLRKMVGKKLLKTSGQTKMTGDFVPLELKQEIEEPLNLETFRINSELDKSPDKEDIWYVRLFNIFLALNNVCRIRLLDLQDRYVEVGLFGRKSLVDKKLSILSKALACLPHSEELLVRYLSIVTGMTDCETVFRMFERAIKANPQSAKIHLLRLRYILSSLEAFSLCRAEMVCREAFQSLCSIDIALALQFSLFYCRILAYCGWKTKSIGMYQALVEFLCFHVSKHSDLRQCEVIHRLSSRSLFILFWQSFAFRIGERARHDWTEWLHSFLETIENQHEQLFSLQSQDDEELMVEEDSNPSNDYSNPSKLPSVLSQDDEWTESEWSSSSVSESSDTTASEDFLTIFPAIGGKELRLWLQGEERALLAVDHRPLSLSDHLSSLDKQHQLLEISEPYCLPRDIFGLVPFDMQVDQSVSYQVVSLLFTTIHNNSDVLVKCVEMLVKMHGWPFLDTLRNYIVQSEVFQLFLQDELLPKSFSLCNMRDIEQLYLMYNASIFDWLSVSLEHRDSLCLFASKWLLGFGYFYCINSQYAVPSLYPFVLNVYSSLLFNQSSIFHQKGIQQGDVLSLRIAEAFVLFQGVVEGFSKARSTIKKFLKERECYSLYMMLAELAAYHQRIEECKAIYLTCLTQLNTSTWEDRGCTWCLLSYLFHILTGVSDQQWETRKIESLKLFRVLLGNFSDSNPSLTFTEKVKIRTRLQKMISSKCSQDWTIGEEIHCFSLFACQLCFEWLAFGMDQAVTLLQVLETNGWYEMMNRPENNKIVLDIVRQKCRQLLCLLIFYEWTCSHHCLKSVRVYLEEALRKDPQDELILLLYASLFRYYAAYSSASCMRTFFARLNGQSAVFSTFVAQIVAETGNGLQTENPIKHWPVETKHRFGNQLERSVSETGLGSSAFFWVQYLTVLFEDIANQDQLTILKKAFYRALTHAPYSKGLVIAAFRFLGEHLSIQEAKDIASIAMEKGILFSSPFPYL
eukprot:jgi/Galph1/5587/GphlegSOOS_G4281.1